MQDGFFAFVKADTMDLWKLKLNSGVGRSLILTPKTLAGQSVVVWGKATWLASSVQCLTFAVCVVAQLILTISIALSATLFTRICLQYAEGTQRGFLKQYIAKVRAGRGGSMSELCCTTGAVSARHNSTTGIR